MLIWQQRNNFLREEQYKDDKHKKNKNHSRSLPKKSCKNYLAAFSKKITHFLDKGHSGMESSQTSIKHWL